MFVSEVLKSMDDWDFQGEIATAPMVVGQQEYIFPTDILKIKRIEATYDGTNWNHDTRFDINDRTDPTDTTSITNDFNVNDPFVDIYDNSIFLYPIPTSASGIIKIWYEKLPTALSAVTDEPVFARPYHVGLAYGAAKDYCEQYPSKENATRLTTNTNNLTIAIGRMKEFYQKKDQDRDYIVESQFVDYDYGNN